MKVGPRENMIQNSRDVWVWFVVYLQLNPEVGEGCCFFFLCVFFESSLVLVGCFFFFYG